MIDWRSRRTLAALTLAAGLLAASFVIAQRRAQQQPPARPRRAAAQTTRLLRQGDNLQAALDAARPGDTITLEAGATFVGPFTLPAKQGDSFITVQSSALAQLPPESTRVTPSHAPLMPKVVSPGRNQPALQTAAGAHHFRFVGIEFKPADARAAVVNLVELGDDGSRGQRSLGVVPHHLVFDRCYVHGDSGGTLRRGFALNSAHTEITNSHVGECKEKGNEAQAILGWNGPGPFRVVNNYLEAAGENVMFGGGDPAVRDLVPSDIEILGNHLRKPPEWRGAWTVKNLFELKNARRVRVEDNLFEYNWADAQTGIAILLTPRNQEGNCPWCVVEDVTFRNNVVRHAGGGVNILGRDDLKPSRQTRRVSIVNNLFEDIDAARWGGMGLFLQITGAAEVAVERNTVLQSQHAVFAYGEPTTRFTFRDNIARHNDYGVFGDAAGVGQVAIDRYFPGAAFVGNVFVGAPRAGSRYPAGNTFVPTLRAVGFVDHARGDYRLAADSPVRRRASDGGAPGCDPQALGAALRAAEGVYVGQTARP